MSSLSKAGRGHAPPRQKGWEERKDGDLGRKQKQEHKKKRGKASSNGAGSCAAGTCSST